MATNPLQVSSQMTAIKNKPNFQTITGQNVAMPTYKAGQPLPTVKAQDPATNVKPVNTTLPPAQKSTYTPPVNTQNISANQTPTYNSYNTAGGIGSKDIATPQQSGQSNTGLYGQLIGQLQQASQPSQTQTGLINQLRDTSTSNPLEQGGAYNTYQNAVQNLSRFRQNLADANANIEQQPIPLVFQQGREQVLARQAAQQENALSQAVTQAQQALGYGIQEQQAQQSGLGTALSGANTQQQLQQQGLGTIAGMAPEALRYQAFGGGDLSPQVRAQSLAQQVQAGLISPQAAEQQLTSLYGGVGSTFLNQALQGGYNYNVGNAQAAAQQSNVQTQGTAQTDIARTGLQDATQQYVQMNSAAQFAGQQSQAVTNILNQAGLNNVSSTDYNKALNNLKGRFGDTNFASLNTALIEARSAYANLLSTGGQTPSGNESQALATLDINQPASQINASIQQLENAVARRLQAQYGAMQTYQQNLGGGGQLTGTNSSGATGLTWDNIGD